MFDSSTDRRTFMPAVLPWPPSSFPSSLRRFVASSLRLGRAGSPYHIRFGRLATLCVLTAAATNAASADDSYQKLLDDNAERLVTVKYILKMGAGGSGDDESENELTGVMIDPKGIILCSNTQLGGYRGMMMRMSGGDSAVTPTDIKVLIGDDVEGIDGELIARDTELDLAWIRIKEPGDRQFSAVDLAAGIEAKVGDRLLALRRMGKFFGRALVVNEGYVGGATRKPRELLIPSGDIGTALGLPVFSTDGRVIGVSVVQMPSPEDMAADPTGGAGSVGALILSAEDVVRATRRAMEVVADAPKPAEGEKPAEAPEDKPAEDDGDGGSSGDGGK